MPEAVPGARRDASGVGFMPAEFTDRQGSAEFGRIGTVRVLDTAIRRVQPSAHAFALRSKRSDARGLLALGPAGFQASL